MDIAHSYPENQGSDQESTTALNGVLDQLDRMGATLLDQVAFPDKTAAQIRQIKAIQRKEEEKLSQTMQSIMASAARFAKIADEQRQQREDQRVIADDIRNRQRLPPPSTQEPPTQAENWVTSAKLKSLLATRWKGVGRLCRNPDDYPWSAVFRKPDPAYKGRYLWEAVGLAKEAERRKLMKPEVSPDISEQCSSPQGLIVAFSSKGRG